MFKVQTSLFSQTPRVNSLLGEAVSSVKDTINKAREQIGRIPAGCDITSVTLVSRSSGVVLVRAYAGDNHMFQFEMFYVPCSRGRGGIQNDWIRYRCSIVDLARAYSDNIDYQLSQEE